MNNKIDYNDLKYVVESSGNEYRFYKLKDPITFLDDIEKGQIKKKKTLGNINILFNARDNAIKFIEDYGSMILAAKKLAKEQEGKGLKKLTSNQMFKKLPIALAQIKAGYNSESLLNEIRQIVYYLYQSIVYYLYIVVQQYN